MVSISESSVLGVFSLVRDAILADSVLSARFGVKDVYQFEPKHKGVDFKGFPYFWVDIPDSPEEKAVFDNSFTMRDLSVPVFLRVEWHAREKVLGYCNAFIKAIRAKESSFQSSGYYDVMVDLVDVNPSQVVDQKEVVEAEFVLGLHGHVAA